MNPAAGTPLRALSLWRGTWIIARRELGALFVSPIAYVALSGFAVLAGWFFFNLLARFQELASISAQLAMQRPDLLQQINLSEMVIQPTYLNLTVILVILFPLLTMRLMAEERRQGTDELLLTSPVGTGGIVLGKFVAIMLLFTLMLALTASFPAVLRIWGDPAPGWGELAAPYLGLWLMGAAFAAVGLFTSSITTNQIVAAVSCFVLLLMFYVIDWIAMGMSGTARDVLEYLSLIRRYHDFVKGVVDLKSVVYFLSIAVLGLFLSRVAVDGLRVRR